MALPETDLHRIRLWARERVPEQLWDQVRVEADVSRAAELEADLSIDLTWTNWTRSWLRGGASPSDREGIQVFLIIDLMG